MVESFKKVMMMIQIKDKNNCCGCTACASVCPRKCIQMVEDNEGFKYPKVNEEQCITCGLCEKVCPIIRYKQGKQELKGVAVQHREKDVLYHSAAGGAFSAIAAYVIKKNGIVFGAAYNENMVVTHMAAENISDLEKFRSSKYVQSQMEDIFQRVKNELRKGRYVCFSGTPCQVTGLKYFLGQEYEKLITVDLVCKGVGSPAVLREYVKDITLKYNSRVIGINFKRKTYGYHSSTMSVDFENGSKYSKSGITDPMMRSFRANICLRPSCATCKFKGEYRVSDLTIFDCWHYSELTGRVDDDCGHTAVLIHSKLGEQIIQNCSEFLTINTIDPMKAIELDGIMVRNQVVAHKNRRTYFEKLNEEGLDAAIQSTIPIRFIDKVKEASKIVLYKFHLLDVAKKIGNR